MIIFATVLTTESPDITPIKVDLLQVFLLCKVFRLGMFFGSYSGRSIEGARILGRVKIKAEAGERAGEKKWKGRDRLVLLAARQIYRSIFPPEAGPVTCC